MDATECVMRAEALRTERSNLDETYNLIDKFVVPGRGRLYTKGGNSSGGENAVNWRRRELYDSTAMFSAQTLAASINGSLTSPATRWFTYRFRDPKLNDSTEASAWLEDCQERVFFALYESNFSVEAAEFYLDAVTFGTPGMAHDYEMVAPNTPKQRFRTMATRDFYFETDFSGVPIALFQFKDYTAGQIALEFEEPYPKIVQAALDNATHIDTFEVVHAIYLDRGKSKSYASANKGGKAPSDNRPYQEKFVMAADKTELISKRPAGYYEMPAYVLRWGRVAGSKFGYSPAINSMPDILTLNQLVEMDLRAREKAIDPPLLSQQRGIIGDIDLSNGGLTFVRDINGLKPLESAARFDVSEGGMGRLINAIRSSFFVDQLELKESPAMTATEVNVRYELMQRLLGPTLARFKTDFLDPMLSRTFWIMFREGALPPMPEGVDAATLDIEYVGPMARNQKLDEVVAIERIVQALQTIGPMAPDTLDTFDWNEVTRLMADRLGVPAKCSRSKKEIKAIQDGRKQQQEQAAKMEQVGAMASAMKDGSAGAKNLQDAGLNAASMEGMM